MNFVTVAPQDTFLVSVKKNPAIHNWCYRYYDSLLNTCIGHRSNLIDCLNRNILKDFENASPRLNPLFHKP